MRDPVSFSGIHRICKLIVLLCFLHISVVFIFYVRSFDIRLAFVQKGQTLSSRLRNSTARPYPAATNPVRATGGPATEHRESDLGDLGVSAVEGLPVAGSQRTLELGTCPETSPLLGKDH